MGTSRSSPLSFIRIADNTIPGRDRRVVLVEKDGQNKLVTKGFWGRVALRIQDLFTKRDKVVARNQALIDNFSNQLNSDFGKVIGPTILTIDYYNGKPLYESDIRDGVDRYRQGLYDLRKLQDKQARKGNNNDKEEIHLSYKYVSPIFEPRATDIQNTKDLFPHKSLTGENSHNPFEGKDLHATELAGVLACVLNDGKIINNKIVKDVVRNTRVESKYAPLIRQAISGLGKFEPFEGTVYIDTGRKVNQKEYENLTKKTNFTFSPDIFQVACDTDQDEKKIKSSKNVVYRINSKNGRKVYFLGSAKVVFPPGTSYVISDVTRNLNNKGVIVDLTEQ